MIRLDGRQLVTWGAVRGFSPSCCCSFQGSVGCSGGEGTSLQTSLSFGVGVREGNRNGRDIANGSSMLQLIPNEGIMITSACASYVLPLFCWAV